MPCNWKSLCLAREALESKDDGRLRYAFGNVDDAITHAIQSAGVPTRGIPEFTSAFKRIEQLMTDKACLTFGLSQIAIGGKIFRGVEVDIEALESYMIASLVLPDIQLWVEPEAATPTSAAETAFVSWVKVQPPEPIPTKKAVLTAINSGRHELSEKCGHGKLSRRALDRSWIHAPVKWRSGGRRPDS
jgi:hypothetical protein